ncbi:MAG: helix-turn-helix domain-containing protein [Oricola sp.]
MPNSNDNAPLVTVVVGTPEAGASGTMAILDVLSAVGRSWERLHGEEVDPPRFRPRLLSLDGKPYQQPNGVTIEPHGRLDDIPAPDIVIVPELVVSRDAPLPESYGEIAEWIKVAYARGAIVASVCSGALLLAQTGLLDGEEATTHWGFCDTLARRHPRIRIRKERILVPTGPGHRIITAGGASSWYDLLLYLVARFGGPEKAREVAKVFLVQAHNEGQLPYAGLTAKRQHEDQLIAEAQLWLADFYSQPNPVGMMAARSGLTERGFLKRFRRATGLAPMEYVQTLRIEEAKHLLETTEMALDEVAEMVGYVEPASFRRLFRRMVGVSPSVYRRRHMLPHVLYNAGAHIKSDRRPRM